MGRVADVVVQETDLFREVGWPRSRVGIASNLHLRRSAIGAEGDGSILVKRAFGGVDGWAAALSAGAVYSAYGGCVGQGGEARAALGRTFGPSRRPAGFASFEAAYRAAGGCGGLKTEFTIGYRPEHKWLLLAKAYGDRAVHGTDTLKVQVSAVRFGPRRGIELGVRVRVNGGDPEPALIASVWRGRG